MMVRGARLLAPFALAALSTVAALSLDRVVDSSRFVLPVLGAVVLPHAIGALVRWRNWSVWVGVALSALGLTIYVVLALEPSTTTLGLPGSDTWHAIERQLSGGWHLLRTAPAPAPTTDGAVLLAVFAVWCMSALADWLAFGRHTALAAISPALVFFVWTSTLGTDDTEILPTIAFCVAAGAFVLVQHLAVLEERRSWLVSQHASKPRWLAPAAVLGGGAIVFALAVAPLVPGAGSDPILDVSGSDRDGSGGRSYRPSLAPFVDIGRRLDDVNDVELFTVGADRPDYWRVAALDRYSGENGGQWTLSAEGEDGVSVGLPTTAPAGTFQQQFAIGPLGERWLPAAYRPEAISLPDTLVVRSSSTLVADAREVSNLRYTVASALPPLAGTQLSAEEIAATSRAVPATVRSYTALPATPDIEQIRTNARDVVNAAGATTPYARAAALRDFFRDPANGFQYDTSVGSLDSGSAILQFLRTRRGFCVQFASAYAVMARSLGIPARVAVGFTPGTRAGDGRFHVTSHDAHAWPEIYLSGLGWTHLFDPTPGQSGRAPGGSALPNDTAVGNGATVTTLPPATTTPATPVPGNSQNGGGAAPGTTPVSPTLAPTPVTPSSESSAWLLVVAATTAVVLAIGAYVGGVMTLKRRRRARRYAASDPAVAVTGAWAEALDRLHEAAVVPAPTQTPLDFAATVPFSTNRSTARPLHELASAYSAARYGDDAVADADARAAWSSLAEFERALDGTVSRSRRWRRRLDASTLVRR